MGSTGVTVNSFVACQQMAGCSDHWRSDMAWLWSSRNAFIARTICLHRSKDMSVHVSDCTSYDLKPLIPQGQTVSQAYCVEILKWLREGVRLKRHELWPIDWILHMAMLKLTRRSLSSSFWPKNRLLKWNTHPNLMVWRQVTSDCFEN
jgi:hypothetical protein